MSKHYCTVCNARIARCSLVVISQQFAAALVLFVGRRYYLRPIIRCLKILVRYPHGLRTLDVMTNTNQKSQYDS